MSKINYKTINNSFRLVAKSNPKDLIVAEIGDIKEPSITLPQLKICRWGDNEETNESNVSLRLLDFDEYSVLQNKDKIIFGNEKQEVHIYPITEGEGACEIELILKERPKYLNGKPKNRFEFSVVSKDVDFFYQPALTQEEIDEGAERSEEVVGSYAIYSKSSGGMNEASGKEYKVGKVGHLYRAKLIDANGNETWGDYNTDLNETGILTLSVDPIWLDKAVYPVVVDSKFGYETKG